MTDFVAVDRLLVSTPQGAAGDLTESDQQYLFTYTGKEQPSTAISLTMPWRAEQYTDRHLHPIFQMNLPEGYVLEQIRNRLAKSTRLDPMMLLALTGAEAPVGRLKFASPEINVANRDKGERLEEILAWDGAQSLFAELANRYLFRTGISGVQPKVVVPEDVADAGKGAVTTTDLIVKSGGGDYPGLAVNEFLCMSAVRYAGLPTPEFFLSRNRELFVMRRFDRSPDGVALGFEDMAVLMAKGAEDKYVGSYENVVRVAELYVSPRYVMDARSQLFDQIALSCILGNGDAHLKNFGLLYTDPTVDDVRLAPVYDVVNTTAYIPEDHLALKLGGNKSFFAARVNLIDFAKSCAIDDPKARIDWLIHAVEQTLVEQAHLLDAVPAVVAAIRANIGMFTR